MTETPDEAVRDRRRAPFCYQTIDALAAIRSAFTGQKLSTALAVYVTFTEAANRYGGDAARDGFEATRASIAEDAGVSIDTLDRYVSGLVKVGVLAVERRSIGGVNLPNVWTLTDVASAPPSRTHAATPSRAGAAPRARSSSGPKKTPEEESSFAASGAGDADDPPPIVKIAGRNLPMDALAEVCGIEEGEPRYGQIPRMLNGWTPKGAGAVPELGIVHLAWRETVRWFGERPDGGEAALARLREDPESWSAGLAEMIRRKGARYRERMGGSMLTPKSLRDWWLALNKETGSGGGGLSAEDIERGFS